MGKIQQYYGQSSGGASVRALDRLTDQQLMAVQARVLQGWTTGRIASELDCPVATIHRWFRDPLVMAASAEMTRAYAALELLPLGLQRLRMEMQSPLAKLGDIVRAVELFSKLAGLSDTATGGAPLAGRYAPVAAPGADPTRPIAELSANDLQHLAAQGREALIILQGQAGNPAKRETGDA